MLLAQPGQLHVVRDQYQSATQRPVQSKHLCNDFLPRGKVETASWLIGQEERGLHHKSARQGYTLLFATGKDLRIMLQTRTQPDLFQHVLRSGSSVATSGQFKRQHHILQSRQIRQKLKILEDESHLTAAHGRSRIFVQCK